MASSSREVILDEIPMLRAEAMVTGGCKGAEDVAEDASKAAGGEELIEVTAGGVELAGVTAGFEDGAKDASEAAADGEELAKVIVGGVELTEVAAGGVELAGVTAGVEDVAKDASEAAVAGEELTEVIVGGVELAEVAAEGIEVVGQAGRSVRLAAKRLTEASLRAFLCVVYSPMRCILDSGLSSISSSYSFHSVVSISSSAISISISSRALCVMD